MASCTPQRQPREAPQASVEKGSPAGSSSGDEAVVLLPRGIEDLPEALRSKFSEKARWLAQAGGPRPAAAAAAAAAGSAPAGASTGASPAAPPPALPTTPRSSRGAAAPTAPAAPAPAPAAQAPRARAAAPLLRRRRPQPPSAGDELAAAAAPEPKRKAARASPPEPEHKPHVLPTSERPSARAAPAAAKEPVGTAELEKAKKAAEKASAASAELRRERDSLLKENRGLKRKLQSLEAASTRRAVAASSKTASAVVANRRPVLSLKSAPKEVKVRIKALKTEAKHLRKYGVSITLQQPQGMATWTAAVKGARKELGVRGFKQAKKGSKLYRKAKEINEKLLRRRKAQAKRAARA